MSGIYLGYQTVAGRGRVLFGLQSGLSGFGGGQYPAKYIVGWLSPYSSPPLSHHRHSFLAGFLARNQPARTAQLFLYGDIIYRTYRDFAVSVVAAV